MSRLRLPLDPAGDAPLYSHPPFDLESRMVTVELGELIVASMHIPNGGKDYPAKLNFLMRLIDWARGLRADGRERTSDHARVVMTTA